MPEHQLLELLLTYAIPRRDVNPLAHRLIERYGSLAAVLKADVAELKNAGLGEYAATLIALAGAMRNISEKLRNTACSFSGRTGTRLCTLCRWTAG